MNWGQQSRTPFREVTECAGFPAGHLLHTHDKVRPGHEGRIGSMRMTALIAGIMALVSIPLVAVAQDDSTLCTDVAAKDDARIAACTRVIDSGKWSGPSVAWAYSSRGSAYLSKGNLAKAIADFDVAIKLDPKSADTFYNRGIAYTDKGDFTRAKTDFDSAISLNPNDAGALASRCYVRAVTGSELDAALADCTKSLGLEANGYTNDSRGLVYLKLNRFAEARADYDTAVKEDPKSASSLFGRGVAKKRLGDTAGANKDMAAAKAINSKIAATYASRGVTP
jgi:tetratricopeptide (TPR) repeat protein